MRQTLPPISSWYFWVVQCRESGHYFSLVGVFHQWWCWCFFHFHNIEFFIIYWILVFKQWFFCMTSYHFIIFFCNSKLGKCSLSVRRCYDLSWPGKDVLTTFLKLIPGDFKRFSFALFLFLTCFIYLAVCDFIFGWSFSLIPFWRTFIYSRSSFFLAALFIVFHTQIKKYKKLKE